MAGDDLPARAAPQVPANVSFDAVTALSATPADAQQAYGAAPVQRTETWYPRGMAAPAPVVLFLHGGCWLDAYGVDHARPLAAALRDAGFAVVAPEYRRVGDAGGGWPGTFADIAAVLDALADDARLDLDRLAVVGHSAGGHLALWLGARAGLPADTVLPRAGAVTPEPALVVGLAAIADLDTYARGDSSCETVTPRLMGGMPEEVPERYAAASPQRLPPAAAPVVLIQGTLDSIVPAAQAHAYAARMNDAGGDVRIEWIEGAGHFDPIHPGTAAFARLLEVLRPLLGATS
ncbi:MAG TPA: alpha/beta fold hydrolase [Pseudomonadales bacterium]|nr:alpha/beta fold hydrolase [Pseudomonadales bacterium]